MRVFQPFRNKRALNISNKLVWTKVMLGSSSMGAVDRGKNSQVRYINNFKIIKGRDLISNKLLCRWLLQFYLSDLNDFPCIVY